MFQRHWRRTEIATALVGILGTEAAPIGQAKTKSAISTNGRTQFNQSLLAQQLTNLLYYAAGQGHGFTQFIDT